MRPVNAITFPLSFVMGNITRLRKREYIAPSPPCSSFHENAPLCLSVASSNSPFSLSRSA